MGFRGKKGEKKFVRNKLHKTIQKRKFKQKVERSKNRGPVYDDEGDNVATTSDNGVDDRLDGQNDAASPARRKSSASPGIDLNEFTEEAFVADINAAEEEDDDDIEAEEEDEEEDDDDDEDEEDEDMKSEQDQEDEAEDDENGEEADFEPEEDRKMRKTIKKHRSALQSVKEKDPAFFEYLQKTDPELLEFGMDMSDDDDEDEDDEDEDSEDEDDDELQDGDDEEEQGDEDSEEIPRVKGSGRTANRTLDVDTFATWRSQAKKKPSLAKLRRIVTAFRAACTAGASSSASGGGGGSQRAPLVVSEGSVFIAVVRFCATEMPTLLDDLVGVDTSAGDDGDELPLLPAAVGGKKWKAAQPLVKQYLVQVLSFVRDCEGSDTSMQRYALQHAARMAPYFACFTALGKRYVKHAVTLWTAADDKDVTAAAYIAIRRLARRRPFPFLELSIKGLYLAFARATRAVAAHTLAKVALMRNCIVELCGIDPTVTYQHAFAYLRQLAVHLRTALTAKSKEAYQQVYCMQFVQCLEVWVACVCTYNASEELKPLVYPVCQIIVGTAKLMPTPRYFPLRMRCARMATALCAHTGTFVPVAPLLVQIFACPDLHRKPQGGGRSVHFNFEVAVRAPKAVLKTKAYLASVVSEALFLLADHMKALSSSCAFPELALPIISALRKEAKTLNNLGFKKQMQLLAEKLELQSRWVETRRSAAAFGPNDATAASAFLSQSDDVSALASTPLFKHHAIAKKQRDRQTQLAAAAVEDDGNDLGEPDDEDEDDFDSEENDSAENAKEHKISSPESTSQAVPKRRRKLMSSMATELAGTKEDEVEEFNLDIF